MNGVFVITLKIDDDLYKAWNDYNKARLGNVSRRGGHGCYGIVEINSRFFSEKIQQEMENNGFYYEKKS